jgi:hypothetical protein
MTNFSLVVLYFNSVNLRCTLSLRFLTDPLDGVVQSITSHFPLQLTFSQLSLGYNVMNVAGEGTSLYNIDQNKWLYDLL